MATAPKGALSSDANCNGNGAVFDSVTPTEPKPRDSKLENEAASTSAQQLNRNESIFAVVEGNAWFQNMTLIIIVINALWICVDVELNHTRLRGPDGRLPLEPFSTVVDNFFCTYYTIEVLIRFLAFKYKCSFWRDGWFVFDIALVLFMVIETWVLPLVEALAGGGGGSSNFLNAFASFRLLRLLRLTRMARIMRFFPELMTLVKGMVRALKAVSFILMFLLMTMYIFAIVFTSELGKPGGRDPLPGEENEDPTAIMMFATIGDSMMTLFTNGVLGDNLAQTLMAIKDPKGEGGLHMMWIFIAFVVVAQFTLLNMLIGVLCQVISDSKTEEEETNKIREIKQSLNDAIRDMNFENGGNISRVAWSKITDHPGVRKSFSRLQIDDVDLEERLRQMQETLFGVDTCSDGDDNDEGISVDDLVKKVVELRWDMPANSIDLELMKNTVRTDDKNLKRTLERLEEDFRRSAFKRCETGDTTENEGRQSPPKALQIANGKTEELQPSLAASQAIARQLPRGLRVCIVGSTAFTDPASEPLVRALGRAFAEKLAGRVVVLTGGMPGVQQTFAIALGGSFPALVHLLPEKNTSGFGVGMDVAAGATLSERMAIFGQLGDVYIVVEGGPGAASEAAAAFTRGALVLPLMTTGGASSGMFNFPADALQRPACATDQHWSCLRDKVAPEVAAAAVVEIIKNHVETKPFELGGIVGEAPASYDTPRSACANRACTPQANSVVSPPDPAHAWLCDVPTELLFHVLKLKPTQEAAMQQHAVQEAVSLEESSSRLRPRLRHARRHEC
eukprot:TRINITY_DN17027_c0_g3_i4.p1 TRINITY_DN17027_c0_g3~~TRINITY_DN17027_c0_g3_i4.p1  ORF type:complete len:792 (-),score=178.36 TRINITY_DN17027_c0_g3_i4:38-2413(-)